MSFRADPISVRSLFQTGRLVVPKFQRPYSWEKDQVATLADDLKNAYADQDSYFLGTTVLAEIRDSEYEIVDGQQRLTTLMILFAAARDYLRDSDSPENKKLSEFIQDTYLTSNNPLISKSEGLVLGTQDNEVFQRAILSGDLVWRDPNKKTMGRPKKIPIQTAYNVLKNFLNDNFPIQKGKADAKNLLGFLKYIGDKSKLIAVIVESEAAAYSIFETINARGLDLTAADLIKNRVFSSAESLGIKEKAERLWSDIVEDTDGGDSRAVSRFLKTFWLSNYGNVTQKQLFVEFAAKVTEVAESAKGLESFLRQLRDAAAELSDLRSLKGGSETADIVTGLMRLGVTQPFSLLLSAREKKLSESDFKKIVLLVDCLTVRDTIVGSQTANRLEKKYSAWAKLIRTSPKSALATIEKEVKKEFFDDDDFREAFSKLEVGTLNSKYILSRIEHTLNKEKKVNFEEIDLEHICPENPGKDWSTQLGDYIWLIGNLTLVHYKLNRSMKNEAFSAKKKRYKQSKILITQDLVDYKEWGKDEITKRQQDLWTHAKKIWSYDRVF